MKDIKAGEVVADARRNLGWSQAKFAETLGFSSVLISKIEGGARVPSEAFIRSFATLLPGEEDRIREAAGKEAQPDGRKTASLKIVEAIKLARKNGERASRLKSRAQQIQREADEIAQRLAAKRAQFDLEVMAPFPVFASQISDLPEDVIVQADIQPSNANPNFAQMLQEAQLKTGKSIFSLLGAGVIGSGAGAAIGAGAATATYLTVASIATASTGAAISGLAGAAASSATLAAIGGGTLAAGGLGIAGGTAVLTGFVAFPVIAVAAGAVLASGGRLLDMQKSVELDLQRAEINFETNEVIVRRFISRAGRINEIMTVALLAASNHKRTLDEALANKGTIAWSELGPTAQLSLRRVAEITLACLTILALPIGLNLKLVVPDEVVNAGKNESESVPQFSPELDSLPKLENDFIDWAIEESFSHIAR